MSTWQSSASGHYLTTGVQANERVLKLARLDGDDCVYHD